MTLLGYAAFFCPALPLLFISNKLYRLYSDLIFYYWQMYPTALLEFLCKTEIQVSGDSIPAGETSLIIMNHRTRTDWNFLWPAIYHCVAGRYRMFHPLKFVLKDIIRHVPGPGKSASNSFIRNKVREICSLFFRLGNASGLLLVHQAELECRSEENQEAR